MGLQITNNGGESVLTVDVNTQKSTSTSIVVEFFGINDIYVGTWIVHLWKNDPNGTEELEMLDIKEIYLERGSSGSVTFSGLTPNTTYYIGVVTGDYSTWGEDSFSFTTASNTTEGEINGFTITKEVTSHSAYITVVSSNGDGNEYYYDLYLVNSEIDEEHIHVDGGSIRWDPGENMPITYQFDNLVSNTTYWLDTGIEGLGRIEFTTEGWKISLSIKEVTSSSIQVLAKPTPYDLGLAYYTWTIRKVGEETILFEKSGEPTKVNHGGSFIVSGLENNMNYYIQLKTIYVDATHDYVTGVYATTLPSKKFSWTYAGKKKNSDGTYEKVLGDTKGVDSEGNKVDYFYISANEWNEYVTKLCDVKDDQVEGSGTALLPELWVNPKDIFGATLYNKVLDTLWYMEGNEGWTPDDQRAYPDDKVTPVHLNSIKDRLNALIE